MALGTRIDLKAIVVQLATKVIIHKTFQMKTLNTHVQDETKLK